MNLQDVRPTVGRRMSLAQILISLVRPGFAAHESPAERKRIQLVHASTLAGLVTTLPWIPVTFISEHFDPTPFVTLVWLVCVLALNGRGRTWGAAMLLIGFGLVYTDVLLMRRVFVAGEQLYLLALALLPFLVVGGAYTRSAVLVSAMAAGSFVAGILLFYDCDAFFAQARTDPSQFFVTHAALAFLFVLLPSFARQIIEAAEEQVVREQRRTDALLHGIFPADIARQLKDGLRVAPRRHGDASVLFCRIHGLEQLDGPRHVERQFDLLRRIFGAFDELCVAHGVEKIKSFGDIYMVASGVPEPRTDHAEALAGLALALRTTVAALGEAAGTPLQAQIGLNSGPVVAAVLGEERLTYDIWGDTVNTAQRMEALARPGEIRVNATTFAKINHRFRCEQHEVVEVKGKLATRTYLIEAAFAAEASA